MKQATSEQVKNLIQIRKSLKRGKAGNLAENAAFLDFLKLHTEMTAEFNKTWEVIQARMEQYDIKKIDGEWGVIGFTKPVDSFKVDGKVDTKFTKPVLDTTKVKAYLALNGKLPKNVLNRPYVKFYKKINLGV